MASGQAIANVFGPAISNLDSYTDKVQIKIPEEQHNDEYPYSLEYKSLLEEFTTDYDEIMIN